MLAAWVAGQPQAYWFLQDVWPSRSRSEAVNSRMKE